MNKLTAKKCREMFITLFEDKRQDGITLKEDLYMQALQIALPILEQQERGEGDWIEWGGGKRPVISGKQVEVKFRGGEGCTALSGELDWRDTQSDGDIIAYRIIPEQATN